MTEEKLPEVHYKPNPDNFDLMLSLGKLHEKADSLRRELLGNGQPGRIQLLEADHEKTKDAVESINKKIWMFTGGIVVALTLVKYLIKVFTGVSI